MRWSSRFGLLIAALFLVASSSAHAQTGLSDDLFNSFGGAQQPASEGPEVVVSAKIVAASSGKPARLQVTAEIIPNWHVYSLTQKPGGPLKSEIDLKPSKQFTLAGKFQADKQPHIKKHEFWTMPIEEHEGKVTWTAPLKISEGIDLEEVVIHGELNGQACETDGVCIPLDQLDTKFVARLEGSSGSTQVDTGAVSAPPVPAKEEVSWGEPDGVGSLQRGSAEIKGTLKGKSFAPGQVAQLLVEIVPDEGHHTYEFALKKEGLGAQPTLIVITRAGGTSIGVPSTPAEVHEGPGFPPTRYYDGPVTFTLDVTIPETAKSGDRLITGVLGYQICTETSCEQPTGVKFRVTLPVGDTQGGDLPLEIFNAKYSAAENPTVVEEPAVVGESSDSSSSLAPIVTAERIVGLDGKTTQEKESSLLMFVAAGLLGGLILNLMPCVLPVIGLKILSFAEQGGQSRGKVFGLNLAFSAGLLLVFLIIAGVAVGLKMTLGVKLVWAQQFSSPYFSIPLAAMVFVMALSFLGVWELPIPGFASSSSATRMSQQEGYQGAFYKGIFTTILATPCSGPFLGPVFGAAMKGSPLITFLLFSSIGLGMAAPYLLIGAFPVLIRFLPKPGAWMETFKQVMGFVLLGTVVFVFSFVDESLYISTLTLLCGLGFACWWIGRQPFTATFHEKIRERTLALFVATMVGLSGFAFFVKGETEGWKDFSVAALNEARDEGKTVLVDFTADY